MANTGDSYFTLDRPMMALAESLAQRLPDSILCRWPLARVDHGPDGALLYGPSGLRIRCRHLILALPHAILKAESVHFCPPLPAAKPGRHGARQGLQCHQGKHTTPTTPPLPFPPTFHTCPATAMPLSMPTKSTSAPVCLQPSRLHGAH